MGGTWSLLAAAVGRPDESSGSSSRASRKRWKPRWFRRASARCARPTCSRRPPISPAWAIRGLQAYRDLLLDEAAAYVGGEIERLAVVAVQYQSFKRFAIRHGHRIGAAFVMALGERLQALFQDDECVAPCHKTGKSFRLIVRDCSSKQVQALVGLVTDQATRDWIVDRVWGSDRRTHPDEVNFYVGIAAARASERDDDDSEALAQRLE